MPKLKWEYLPFKVVSGSRWCVNHGGARLEAYPALTEDGDEVLGYFLWAGDHTDSGAFPLNTDITVAMEAAETALRRHLEAALKGL